MKQLITLQECDEKETHTNMQRVVHDIERNICQKIDAKFDRASEKVFQQLTRRRHKSNDCLGSSLDAIQDLRAILRPLKRQRSNAIPSYVSCDKVGAHGLVECKDSDLEFPTDEEIQEDMFSKVGSQFTSVHVNLRRCGCLGACGTCSVTIATFDIEVHTPQNYIPLLTVYTHFESLQHNTDEYLQVITNQFIRRRPVVKFEEPDALHPSDFIKPSVKRLEIHHFSHHQTAALSLDGNNLCFTSRFTLTLHKTEKEYMFMVDQKESVSSRSIQIQEVRISVPRDFVSSSDSNLSGDYQETEETADVVLHTHFGEFPFENVEVRHKVCLINS